MKKFAVILSGCGVYDGTEIHEATMSMLAIDQSGAQYELFAPDINQVHVINHVSGEEMTETRNVLVESARIARGKIKNLKEFKSSDYDALLLPGGFGAAKNLSNYAFKGADIEVNKEVADAIIAMHKDSKPIGALCIAPVLLSSVIKGSVVTIGNDISTSEHVLQMGSEHKNTQATEIVIDEKNKIVTSPCYMLGTKISEIYTGAVKVVDALLKLM
jgi:enhancing lycopene biosynthesis protein 2